MTVNIDGWLDWAERMPGPPDKKYAEINAATIYVPHSAVGYLNGWLPRLFSLDKLPDGQYTPYAAASVHGWIAYDGKVIQHYPITVSCWASGSRYLNTNGVAFENAGGFNPVNEPLTVYQVAANARIIRELGQWKGLPVTHWRRPVDANDKTATLYEHRETVRFGGASTACPSDRIPWQTIIDNLGGEDMKDGWLKEGDFWVLYNFDVPVIRIGGQLPGRISKLFGDHYLWLRVSDTVVNGQRLAFWSPDEGD